AEISACPPAIVPTYVAHHAAHDDQGPHGGQLIEIGRNHAYHAEMVIDQQTGAINVYLLDRDLKDMEIEQGTITLAVSGNNLSQSAELRAAEVHGGKASQFVTSD